MTESTPEPMPDPAADPGPISVLPRLPMTKALGRLLADNVGGHPVGLAKIPRVPDPGGGEATVPAQPPYFILFPLWVTSLEHAALATPDADADWIYQISCYAARADQLEWMQDRVRHLLLARYPAGWQHPLDVPGIRVMDRSLADSSSDTEGLAADLRFVIKVTPSNT